MTRPDPIVGPIQYSGGRPVGPWGRSAPGCGTAPAFSWREDDPRRAG